MGDAFAVGDRLPRCGGIVHGHIEQLQRERRLVDGESRRVYDVVVVDERALVVFCSRRGAERIVAGIARGVGSDAVQDVLHLEVIGGVLVHFGVDDAVNVRDCDRILLGAVVGHGVGVRKRDGDVPLGDCERDGAVCVLGDGVVAFDVLERHIVRRGADPLIGSDIVADVGGFDVLLVLFGDAAFVVDGAEPELVRRHCALRIVARIVGHDVAVLERGDSFGIRREVEHEPSLGNLDGDGRLRLLEVFRLRHADDDLIGADIDQRRTVARDGELRVGRADIDVCHIFGIVRREVVLSRSGVAADKLIERFERSCALRHIDERIAVRRPVEFQRVSRDRIVNRHRSLVRGRVRNRLESGVVEDEVVGVHEARRHSVLARVFSVGLFKRSVEVGSQVVAERHDVNALHSSAQAVGAQDFRLGVLRSAVVDQALIAARHERNRSLRNRERPIRIGVKIVGVDVVVGVVDAGHGDEVVPGVDHLGHVDFGRRAVVISRCDRGLRIVAGDGAAQHEFERLRFAVIDEFRLFDTERELALRDLEHIVARRAVVVAVVALVGDEFLIRDDEVVSGVLFVRVDEAHVVGADIDRGRPAGIGLALADRPIGVVVDLAEACYAVRRPHLQHGMDVGRVVERLCIDRIVFVRAALVGDILAVIAHIVLDLSAGGEGDFSRFAQSSLPLDGVGLIGLSAVHVRTFAGRAAVGVRPKDAARVGRSGIGDLQAGQRTDRAGLVLERDLSGALVRGCVDRGGGIARVVRKRRGGCGVAVPIEVGDRAAFARADQHIFTSDIVFGSIFYGSAGRGAGIVGQHTVDRGDAARRARRAECQRFGIGRRNGDPHQCAGS